MPHGHPSFPTLAALFFLAACSREQPVAANQPQPVGAASVAPAAAQPPPAEEASAITDNHIDVPFAEGSAAIDPVAEKQLDLAARLFRDAAPAVMFSAGCSDASGDEFANLILSARRAKAVRQGLADRGIPPDRLLLRAYGISEPAEPGRPDAASNRRVIVTWRMQ